MSRILHGVTVPLRSGRLALGPLSAVLKGALLYILPAVLTAGCKVYSITDLANPGFSSEISPKNFSRNVLENYTAGNVIVRPQILFSDPQQTRYQLYVLFYSKTTPASMSVNAVRLAINGTALDYGNEFAEKPILEWKLYPENAPYYVAAIEGAPIDRPLSEMTHARVDVSFVVSVEYTDGTTVKKEITSHFLPTKRSYIE